MGRRNYLIEGVSGSGKTTVCDELGRRGHQAVHGDRVLAYQGDPETGKPTPGFVHGNHIWDVARVQALVADRSHEMTFFCGGSRNSGRFIGLMDGVFVLEVDAATLERRLIARPANEFGGLPEQRAFVLELLASRQDLPAGAVPIDATLPPALVADAILAHCG